MPKPSPKKHPPSTPTPPPPTDDGKLIATRKRFIEAGANFCKNLGLPRSLGQIYSLLYLSARPLSLQEICQQLGISKGSASQGTRQLIAWGAIRHVWIPGSRKDHFEAVTEIGEIIRRTYDQHFKPRLESAEDRITELRNLLEIDYRNGRISQEEFQRLSTRIQALERISAKIKSLLPLLERFLQI